MRSGSDRGERLHSRVWDLLPWYANGTLEEGERRVVESHLAACPRCREELAASRHLGALLRQIPEVAPAPHPAHFARLMARLDAEAPTGWRAALRSPFAALRRLLADTPRPVRWALAAQLALLLGLGLFGARLLPGRQPAAAPPAVYQTLSDAPAPAAPTARLRLVFAPGTSEQQMRDLLLGVRGQIAAGPSPLGVYTVEVPAGPDPLSGVLAHLRAQRQVSLAEPAGDR